MDATGRSAGPAGPVRAFFRVNFAKTLNPQPGMLGLAKRAIGSPALAVIPGCAPRRFQAGLHGLP
jgi:hypothetical protein